MSNPRAPLPAACVLRAIAGRRLVPGLKLLHYWPEGDALVPVIVTITKVKRMFGFGPVLGYSFTSQDGRGEVGGGVEAVILVEDAP